MHRPWIVALALLLVILALPPTPGHAGKLSDDGRAGVVLDVQGTALVRPAGRARWTPLGPKSVLHPGDIVRTRPRGAHALEIALAHGKALLGPGVELQITTDGTPRLLRGEAEMIGTPEKPFPIRAAGDLALDLKGTAWLRAEGKRTTQLEEAPRWVTGYRASASNEWMGSLLAKVDGREVPLAVGYHKVDVEVRDQIARTTVEQSFVNSTKSRLEGVFYFPLPADASISGFGMWIGGELVEADIVERQRARQIYEDILRRKKDPGLLEWEGGNIFKARVFPIEPHSEKRIRIRYTQVLPMEGDTWRYRYALRSELLQSKPLRELQIAVRVVSTRPMREIASPTHEITLHETGHEATAEFRASEYRPKDDFELAVKVDRSSSVTAIPHRRGEDGYFMLMVAPPAEASGGWTRDLAPEGKPLDVILLADTSGSMDAGARRNQAAFLEGMLSLLGSKDRFRLAAFDAGVHWIVAEPTAPDEDSIRAALDDLAERRSLGWTDLDGGMQAALAKAGEDALVVYVGDGVSTTGDADAVATAQRMRALGKTTEAAVHAVAASSSFEQGVLQALAETGGGSVRTIGASPTLDAYALLAEAARPSVKDLRVRVEGIRTARVYPERLPNLPLGSQQVVLGRFLPKDEPQEGRVVVEGSLDGKPVRYTAPLRIPAADVGNSFLPRLWGRKHIDALLAQGGPEINEEIVSFSERFGIMTPLTSFLVLESDEDRERYGVQRRVRMRDGERFFADAKDRARLEQQRDLMRAAGRWRNGLRRNALLEIARLGRDLPIQAGPPPESLEVGLGETVTATTRGGFGFTQFGQNAWADKDGDTFFTDSAPVIADRGLALRNEVLEAESLRVRETVTYSTSDGGAWGESFAEDEEVLEEAKMGIGGGAGGRFRGRGGSRSAGREFRGPSTGARPGAPPPMKSPARSAMPAERARSKAKKSEDAGDASRGDLESQADLPPGDLDDILEGVADAAATRAPTSPRFQSGGESLGSLRRNWAGKPTAGLPFTGEGRARPRGPGYGFTLQTLGFPAVPGAPAEDDGTFAPPWSEEVLALLRSLPRREAVRSIDGGLHFVLTRAGQHPTRGTATGNRTIEAWIGGEAWRVRTRSLGFAEPRERWSHAGTRGALAETRRLARTRAARPTDGNAWWLPIWDLRARDVLRAWAHAGYRARIASTDGTQAIVELTRRFPDERTIRLTIDASRRVITETRWIHVSGRTLARLVRSDFVEVAGRHWAQRIERRDADDRVVERRTLRVRALDKDTLGRVLAEADADRADALTVHGPLPARHEAKDAVRARKATFLDHLVLSISLGQQQRMAECLEAWEAAAKLADGKPGRRWVRAELVVRLRRGEEAKQWLLRQVPVVAKATGQDGRFLSAWLHGKAASLLGPRERGVLLDQVRTRWIDEDTPQAAERTLLWEQRRIGVHDALGEPEIAHPWRAKLATTWPHRLDVQFAHEADLWNTGRFDRALTLLETAIGEREPWTRGERGQLYRRLTDRLWDRRQLTRLHERLQAWIATKPRVRDAWHRYYSSFYYLGRADEADARVRDALGTTLADDDPLWHDGKLAAAIDLALGSGWHFNVDHIHPPLLLPTTNALVYEMRRLSKRPGHGMRIFRDWRFTRTDRHRAVREAFFADLQADGAIAAMPLHKLRRYLQLLPWNAGQAPDAVYAGVLASLETRWAGADEAPERTQLEADVLRLLDARGKREEAIAFLRTARAKAVASEDGEAVRLANALFARLLGTPDRDPAGGTAREDECFGLLPALLDPAQPADTRRAVAATNVRRLADRVYRWRYAEGLGTPESRKELSRAALKVLRREVRTRVRGELAVRLGRAEKEVGALFAPWFQLERLGYAVEHGEGLEAIVAEAGTILASDWTRPDPDGDLRPLDRLARERAAVVMAYAATRQNASAELTAGVLRTFADGEAGEPPAATARDEARALLDWRYQTWRLQLALDDATGLEASLRRWIVPAKSDSRWRVALGYVLAETGRIAEAAEQFEVVHGLDELGAEDYENLATWYLVLDDDARRDKAILERYAHMNEGQLSSLVYRYERSMRSRRGGVPGDFDPESVRVLRALMRKATYPGNYWYRIRNLYRSTKDFRILEPVADGLVGHSKEATYGFLGQVSRLTGEVHEEATLDSWNARLTAMLDEVDGALDKRALWLAIARVEGRASKVMVKDPAHGERALAALKNAFENDWQPGEPLLMANYLAALGAPDDPAVRAEQLRQLAALEARAAAGTRERLLIADAHARTLWTHGAQDRAIDHLASALDAMRAANKGRIPMADVRIFDRHVNWLATKSRFADAERVLLREIDRWDLPHRRRGLTNRLYVLYVDTLRRQGRVSIGRGEQLFAATRDLVQAAMLEDPAHAGPLLATWCNLHRQAAAVRKPADAAERLERWTQDGMPAFLARVPLNAVNHVGTVASTIRDIRGPDRGVAVLLARHAAEPSWLGRIGYTVWVRHTYSFARWRREAGAMPELDPKLEALVVAQLEHNLKRGGNRGRWFWQSGNKWSWPERFDVFADTTSKVAELNADSEAVVVRCAHLLRHRLRRTRAGVDVLAAAHARGLLQEGNRWTLVRWHTEDRDFAKALPIVDALIAARKDNLGYRTKRVDILVGLGRRDDARAELEGSAKAWTERKQWREGTAATLGSTAAKHRFADLAETWMEEAIRLRQEARGHRGGRDSTLGRYYRSLALARAQLGKAESAVQAASTALLMANPRYRREMNEAHAALRVALEALPSLPGYIETYDAQVAKTGLDAPVLRKAFAQVFQKRAAWRDEITQLLAARELDPLDATVHARLVKAFDAAGDPAGAVDALFGSITLNPRDHDAYEALAVRYEKAGNAEAAERARTTLAEVTPHQAAGHRKLATIRERQKRLPEAVVQWRQVVRTEKLDPTGHVSLARALVATGAKDEAREILQMVIAGNWESRFDEVKKAAAVLLGSIEQ